MSTDFNPGKYEQPDHGKDELQSAKTGFGLLLFGCFAIGQSVLAFSRVAGTSGPIFVLAQVMCIIAQFWYYEAVAESVGEDAIGIFIPILIQLGWFAYTIIATFRWRLRGVEFELAQPGFGILHRWMPSQSLPRINFISDLLVAVALTGTCFLLESPILGRWYLLVTFAVIFTHLWLDWRDSLEMRRIQEAQRRARHWSARLNQANRR